MSTNNNFDILEIRYILNKFNLVGLIESIEAFGNGLINSTYKVSIFDGYESECYILQKINDNVFKDIEGLMSNISIVTEHISKKLDADKNSKMKTIKMIKAADNKTFVKTEEGYFRMYRSIENAISFDVPQNEEAIEKTGATFGEFHKLLLDLDQSLLVDTIPNFHNTPDKTKEFVTAIKKNSAGRLDKILDILSFVNERSKYAALISNRLKEGLPVHVTHNDPKYNNILFDESTHEPVAVIDLDTIMPGPIAYDFGDAIRSACNTSVESEKDLNKVEFDINHFKAFTKGYFSSMQDKLSEREVGSLVDGCFTITYELGLRFLTDYINGDKYFKTTHSEENLERAKVQFKLLESMEEQKESMKKIVWACAEKCIQEQSALCVR